LDNRSIGFDPLYLGFSSHLILSLRRHFLGENAMSKIIRVTFLIAVCALIHLKAVAQPHDYKVAQDDASITLMPELKNAPAPNWLKPGMRLVYHQASASVPITGMTIVEDPDGSLINKATGQHFRQDENPGTGGHGYLQVDVISVQPDAVVFASRSYLINGVPTGPLSLTSLSGYVTTPSVVGEVYINPDVAQKYLKLNGDGVKSIPGKYQTMDKTFDAIWQQVSSNGNGITHVWDPQTGLCLHSYSCSTTAASNVTVNGGTQQSGGGTMLTQSTLVSMRQKKIPWTQNQLPAALRDLHELVYEGAQQIDIPGAGNLPTSPIQIKMTVIGRGPDFVHLERTGMMMIAGSAPSDFGKSYVVSGPADMVPLAVDPADLANLKMGQILDRDPATQSTISVSFIGRDRAGHDLLTLSEQYPGGPQNFQNDVTYDRATGLMVVNTFTNPILHQTTRVSLKSKN
jgi:hypothetical protein